MTVLLLSLQFHAALRFLWKDETTKMYRVDAVHMAIVMHQEDALLVLPGAHRCHRQGMRCEACCDSVASLLLYILGQACCCFAASPLVLCANFACIAAADA